MLIWPVLVLLLVLLFYKRDITPPWNPPLPPWNPPQPPQPPQPSPAAQQTTPAQSAQQTTQAQTAQQTTGFSGTFTPPPPIDLNDVFRRPGA